MIVSKVFSSYIFRYSMSTVLVTAISAMFLMVFFYSFFSYYYFKDVEQGFTDELSDITTAFEAGGVDQVNGFIDERLRDVNATPYDYWVTDNDNNHLAGNSEFTPRFTEYGGWLSFDMDVFKNDSDIRYMGRYVIIADGTQFLVTSSRSGVPAYTRFFISISFLAFNFTLVMGGFASFFMTWDFQRHVNRINQSIKAIMAGDNVEDITRTQLQDFFLELL